jgi:anhydro-N-acetylmuramic acid kinase
MIGIGVNTGTSADAIDVVIAKFSGYKIHPAIEVLYSSSYLYPSHLRFILSELVENSHKFLASDWFKMLGEIDTGLGVAFSDAVLKTIRKSGIKKSSISFIGSHGQTVWHLPTGARHKGKAVYLKGYTLQLGGPHIIAEKTKLPVLAHFREKDVALGGQGAPLAPILHAELFRKYAPVVVINIGGIANITVIPSYSALSMVYGFDTGPGNRLIDIAVKAYTHGKNSFDKNGYIAQNGTINTGLLSRLMKDPFVRKKPPKSTGREYYNKAYLKKHKIHLKNPDDISTLTAFTAHSIAYNIKHFVKHPVKQIIICGGGAHNIAIIRYLHDLFPEIGIKTVEELGYKSYEIEPLLFAYLGYLGLNKIPVNLKHITGSSEAFVPGSIYYP